VGQIRMISRDQRSREATLISFGVLLVQRRKACLKLAPSLKQSELAISSIVRSVSRRYLVATSVLTSSTMLRYEVSYCWQPTLEGARGDPQSLGDGFNGHWAPKVMKNGLPHLTCGPNPQLYVLKQLIAQ
jgi:hypothetical protein